MRNLILALVLTLLTSAPEALACGGSGSYRKPARPGQHQHQHTPAVPSTQPETTTPPVAPR